MENIRGNKMRTIKIYEEVEVGQDFVYVLEEIIKQGFILEKSVN